MPAPGRTSAVINAALVLYGQSVFGPDAAAYGRGNVKGGSAQFEEVTDDVLSAGVGPNCVEVVRRAVRRAGRR